jgi:hypothetical protein
MYTRSTVSALRQLELIALIQDLNDLECSQLPGMTSFAGYCALAVRQDSGPFRSARQFAKPRVHRFVSWTGDTRATRFA